MRDDRLCSRSMRSRPDVKAEADGLCATGRDKSNAARASLPLSNLARNGSCMSCMLGDLLSFRALSKKQAPNQLKEMKICRIKKRKPLQTHHDKTMQNKADPRRYQLPRMH